MPPRRSTPAQKRPVSVKRRMTPLRVSTGFREFVLGQLADVRGLHARSMFGGIGLYADGVFFGIVAGDVLYLKVDERSRPDYERADAYPFRPYTDRPVTMQYYSVPAGIVEDSAILCVWARRAVTVARTANRT
jgi:DNA transformation protein and related proteins